MARCYCVYAVNLHRICRDIDDYNAKELIKLKTFIVKLLLVVALMFILAIILFAILVDSGTLHTSNSFLNELAAFYNDWTNN